MNLYDDVMLCAHLTSQIELRQKATLLTPFEIKVGDEIDDQATAVLNAASWVTELNTHILDSVMYGHTLVELTTTGNTTEPVAVTLLPRQNVIPEKGMLLFREDDSKGLQYREVREFGNFILEFGKDHDYGLLNKAVPHVLFMRFAQSCWSELCEIYGIPPRFMKTDTQDPAMLDRAEAMLRDMGAAAYFIIDRTEEFQFAKGADTNGDVYNNLIALCKEAVSVLVNGAVIGQDTVNGNRSKEESSIRLFEKLVMADRKMLAGYWNSTVIPALVYIGILPREACFPGSRRRTSKNCGRWSCSSFSSRTCRTTGSRRSSASSAPIRPSPCRDSCPCRSPGKSIFSQPPPDRVQGAARKTGGGLRTG